MTTRRQEHIAELKDRMSHKLLERFNLEEVEMLGFVPYDFKIVHDDLVERGYSPLPNLSDGTYRRIMDARKE